MDTFFATAANKRCPLVKANFIKFDPCDLSKRVDIRCQIVRQYGPMCYAFYRSIIDFVERGERNGKQAAARIL